MLCSPNTKVYIDTCTLLGGAGTDLLRSIHEEFSCKNKVLFVLASVVSELQKVGRGINGKYQKYIYNRTDKDYNENTQKNVAPKATPSGNKADIIKIQNKKGASPESEVNIMLGAITGDMVGAPYEFDRGDKTKDFPLWTKKSQFTDDTVMTIAVAQALMNAENGSRDDIFAAVQDSMQKWGRRYPYAGYGGMFRRWLRSGDPKPYGSFGNGSAMRVSSAGFMYDTLERTREIAALTAMVTHSHPEGIKGAEAAASAIFMARTGSTKAQIKEYIVREFGYDLSRTCDEIRPTYRHVETCQKTVPEAVTAFLEGESFEDVIRTAVSLGGDSDTLTCIAGGIAEAFYGIPDDIVRECRSRLPVDMIEVIDAAYGKFYKVK